MPPGITGLAGLRLLIESRPRPLVGQESLKNLIINLEPRLGPRLEPRLGPRLEPRLRPRLRPRLSLRLVWGQG